VLKFDLGIVVYKIQKYIYMIQKSMEILEKTRVTSVLTDFTTFIKKYGVVGLAIGVVIGQAVNKLVTSIVDNLLNPILGKILGLVELKEFAPFGIKVGIFLTDFINFLAVTFVVYLAIRLFIVYLMTDEEKSKFDFLKQKQEENIEQVKEEKSQKESDGAEKANDKLVK
jgi:large conductance mechanosensitive channel